MKWRSQVYRRSRLFDFSLWVIFLSIALPCSWTQSSPYQLSFKNEATIIGLSGGAVLGNYFFHKSIGSLSVEELATLDPREVWTFDRSATRNWSPQASDASDVTLLAAGLIPFTLAISNSVRKDYLNVGILFLETLLVNSAITDLTKGVTRRYRPLVYNPDVPESRKIARSARLSFYSGHTSGSAAFSFFAAKVFSDHFPNSKWKPVVWTLASILPATTGYLRYRAGKHYPSDVIVGYIAGAAVGYFIPQLHKIRGNTSLSFQPFIGLNGSGLSLQLAL